MYKSLREPLEVLYSKKHLSRIVELLNREGGFCFMGQKALIEMLLYVQEYENEEFSTEHILDELESLWEMLWMHQDPSIRGDPLAPGNDGIISTSLLELFFNAFEIRDSGWPGEPTKIPEDSFRADTLDGVTYQFGSVGINGIREISCVEKPLDFWECTVYRLSFGKPIFARYKEDRWIKSRQIIGLVNSPWYSAPLSTIW